MGRPKGVVIGETRTGGTVTRRILLHHGFQFTMPQGKPSTCIAVQADNGDEVWVEWDQAPGSDGTLYGRLGTRQLDSAR